MVDHKRIIEASYELDDQKKRSARISSEIWDVQLALKGISGMGEVCRTLGAVCDRVARESRQAGELSEAAERVGAMYREKEEGIRWLSLK